MNRRSLLKAISSIIPFGFTNQAIASEEKPNTFEGYSLEKEYIDEHGKLIKIYSKTILSEKEIVLDPETWMPYKTLEPVLVNKRFMIKEGIIEPFTSTFKHQSILCKSLEDNKITKIIKI